eukprot:11200376-Lingulodinium_polyedra.AAC.1
MEDIEVITDLEYTGGTRFQSTMPAIPLAAYLDAQPDPAEDAEEQEAKKRKVEADPVWESLIIQHPWLKDYEEKAQGYTGVSAGSASGGAAGSSGDGAPAEALPQADTAEHQDLEELMIMKALDLARQAVHKEP